MPKTHPVAPPPLRGCALPLATYRRRRQAALRLAKQAFGGPVPILVIASPWSDPVLDLTPVAGRHRQDPWFDWLCGCAEGGALLLLDPQHRQPDTLFLEVGDPARVVWDGARLPPNAATKKALGMSAVAPMEELKGRLARACDAAGGRLAMLWRDREPGWQSQAVAQWRRKLRGIELLNAEPLLVPLRRRKDADEVALTRRAIAVTWAGLKAVLPQIPRMRTEAELAGALIGAYLSAGYDHLAFQPIVGSAVNGATLHYKHNDGKLLAKAPVLIDSGATHAGYCADVTRTLPQHGRFDDPRFREVYELVLRANALGRRHARPGITLRELNELAWKPILDAGFPRLHGLSHLIGLDVHDPGTSPDLVLEAGMIISNEPGVYLPEEGFGIRIEDDLLITADGCEELTRMIPKTVKAVEKAMAGG